MKKIIQMKTETQEKIIMFGLIVILMLLVGMMMLVGRYSCRMIDDYSFSIYDQVWRDTHSVWKTIVYQFKASIEIWKNWQGTYFSQWLYLVINSIFGRNHYYIGSYIAIFAMVASELYASKVVICDILRADIVKAFLISIPVIIIQLMFPPSAAEGFYWMIAAIAYTLAFANEIVLVTLLLKLIFDDTKKNKIWLKICILFLSFSLGGANYINNISFVCIGGILIVYVAFTKKHNLIFIIVNYIWFLCCFLLNALSPGTFMRQSSAGDPLSAIKAIMLSFVEAFKYIKMWWIIPLTLIMIGLIPVFFRIAAKKSYSYKLPVLFTIVTFGIYASQFTPCLYALGIIGAYRVQNLYRFSMYLLVVINEWYWIGYVYRVFEDRFTSIRLKKMPLSLIIFSSVVVLLVGYSMLFMYGKTVTAVSAYYSLRTGAAKQYHEECMARVEYIENCEEADVVFGPLSVDPYLLNIGDLKDDEGEWENVAYANYFSKHSVRIQY